MVLLRERMGRGGQGKSSRPSRALSRIFQQNEVLRTGDVHDTSRMHCFKRSAHRFPAITLLLVFIQGLCPSTCSHHSSPHNCESLGCVIGFAWPLVPSGRRCLHNWIITQLVTITCLRISSRCKAPTSARPINCVELPNDEHNINGLVLGSLDPACFWGPNPKPPTHHRCSTCKRMCTQRVGHCSRLLL